MLIWVVVVVFSIAPESMRQNIINIAANSKPKLSSYRFWFQAKPSEKAKFNFVQTRNGFESETLFNQMAGMTRKDEILKQKPTCWHKD